MEQYVGYSELWLIRHGPPVPNFWRPDTSKPAYDEHAVLTLEGLKDAVRLMRSFRRSNLRFDHLVHSGYVRADLTALPTAKYLAECVEIEPLLGDLWGEAKEYEARLGRSADPVTYYARRPYTGIARPATCTLETGEYTAFERELFGKLMPSDAYVKMCNAFAENRGNPARRQTEHIAEMLVSGALRHSRIIVFGHKSLAEVMHMLYDHNRNSHPVPSRSSTEDNPTFPYTGGFRILFGIDPYNQLQPLARMPVGVRSTKEVPIDELQDIYGADRVQTVMELETSWNAQKQSTDQSAPHVP